MISTGISPLKLSTVRSGRSKKLMMELMSIRNGNKEKIR